MELQLLHYQWLLNTHLVKAPYIQIPNMIALQIYENNKCAKIYYTISWTKLTYQTKQQLFSNEFF